MPDDITQSISMLLGAGGWIAGDEAPGHAGDIEPRTQGVAVDGGDHGNFQRLECQRDSLKPAAVAFGHLGRRSGHEPGLGLHILDIATSAERRALSRQDRHLDRAVAIYRRERL